MDDPLDAMLTCPSCDALNVQGSRVCAECGAELEGSPDDNAGQRLRAAHALGKLRKDLRAVALLYRVQAFFAGIVFVMYIVKAIDSGGDVFELVAGGAIIVVVIAAAINAANQIFEKPLLWSGILAGITALDVIVPGGRIGFTSVLMTALAWMAFIAVLRARPTMRAYPDIWKKSAGRKALASRQARVGTEGARTRVGRRYESSTMRVVVAVFIALALAGVVRWWSNRAPALDTPRTAFEEAWLDEDVARVASYFEPVSRDRMASTLTRLLDKHGWTGDIPPLASGKIEESTDGRRAIVRYVTRDGSMSVTWAYDEAWRVTGIRLPDTR